MTEEATQDGTHIDPSAFAPNLDDYTALADVAETYAYWLGVTAECPVVSVNLAGLTFSQTNELLMPDPTRPGETARVPVIGVLDKGVTRVKIEALRDVLRRTIIRFQPEQKEEPRTGINIGQPFQRGRRGFLITIPSANEIARRAESGAKPLPPYRRQPNDEPAAKYLYMELCADQRDPQRGTRCPPTIAEQGIFWPGKLSAETERLLD